MFSMRNINGNGCRVIASREPAYSLMSSVMDICFRSLSFDLFELLSLDVLKRVQPGLSIDFSCVCVASIRSKEKGNHNKSSMERFFFPRF